MAETFAFTAAVEQLSAEINNTFYPNKEVFLLELLANAKASLEKIRCESIADPGKIEAQPNLFIRIIVDKIGGQLIIEDSGTGMTKNELVTELGGLDSARCSLETTKSAMAYLADDGDIRNVELMGIGFYSAYLVCSKVQVLSKSNDDEQYIWEYAAGSYYFTVKKDSEPRCGRLMRGTQVFCHLKDDQSEFLEMGRIIDLVNKHQELIGFPIYVERVSEEGEFVVE